MAKKMQKAKKKLIIKMAKTIKAGRKGAKRRKMRKRRKTKNKTENFKEKIREILWGDLSENKAKKIQIRSLNKKVVGECQGSSKEKLFKNQC